MLNEIFARVKDFNANNCAIRRIVNSDIFGKTLGSNFKFTLFEPDISSVYLGIIADFHLLLYMGRKNNMHTITISYFYRGVNYEQEQ